MLESTSTTMPLMKCSTFGWENLPLTHPSFGMQRIIKKEMHLKIRGLGYKFEKGNFVYVVHLQLEANLPNIIHICVCVCVCPNMRSDHKRPKYLTTTNHHLYDLEYDFIEFMKHPSTFRLICRVMLV